MKKNVVSRMLLLAASLVLVLAACQQRGTDVDPITGLAVTPAEATLEIGATQQLAAVLEYESGTTVAADVS